MIKNGADVDFMLPQMSRTDPNLAKELREIQSNYKSKPASSVGEVKSNTLKKGANLEL